jgi:hypothetical protein
MKTVSNEVRRNLMFILSSVHERNRGDVRIIWNAHASDIVRGLIDDGYVSAYLDSDNEDDNEGAETVSILFLLVSEPERFALTERGHDLMLWVAEQVIQQEEADERARRN